MAVSQMTQITTLTTLGRFVIPAKILGPFAIHRMMLDAAKQMTSDRWTLTHQPTGRAVAAGMCCPESARELAEKLMAIVVDWNFEDKMQIPVDQREAVSIIISNWPKRCELCR